MLFVTVYIDIWQVHDSKFRHGIAQHDWGSVGLTKLSGILTERFVVEVTFGFWLKPYLIFCSKVSVFI